MPLTPGQQFGPYQILEALGNRGTGAVYRALDSRHLREVAIKILHCDADALARFEREAPQFAELNHPCVAAVHGLEQQDGLCFLVMELVPGETLAERLRGGRLEVAAALQVCRQIATALHVAHARGLCHRNLKPSNVQVTPAGQVKLLDLGLARSLASYLVTATPNEATGAGREVPAYFSPEQTRGELPDQGSDIWSFGCLLYEALCGRQPFAAETFADTLAAILLLEPDWQALPRETPVRLRRLLQDCLRKDRGQRLGEMSTAVRELEAAEGELGRESGQAEAGPLRVSAAVAPTIRTYVPPAPATDGTPAHPAPRSRRVYLAPEPAPAQPMSWRRRHRRSAFPWALGATLVVFLSCCVGGWLGWPAVSSWVERVWQGGSFSVSGPANSVAVLPFDVGGQAGKEGDALAEAINRRLSHAGRKLLVSAHAEAVKYRNYPVKITADSLKVRWLVTGDIVRQGGRVVINAKLIDTTTREDVWSEPFAAVSASDENVADTIARKVAERLKDK
jgi:TolB-like protein